MRLVSAPASFRSPVWMVPISTATTAWVPISVSPTVRDCGNGRRVPPSGLGKAARFSGVSGMSIITPSMAINRRPASQAPGVLSVATGTATLSNSACSGSAPSRALAWDNAPVVGTVHRSDHVRANRNPPTSLRITSS